MTSKRRICLTGGGTAGHVIPHFALLPELLERGHQVFYIGSGGMEEGLVREKDIRFHRIAVGKLRRYVSLDNFFDLFKVAWGVVQAFFILLAHRPDLVFSKGGFVAVPVCVAAWVLRIPVYSHESDLTPGLATRIIKRFARKILYTFPETGRYLGARAVHVGTPVRSELFEGDSGRGLAFAGFDGGKDASSGSPALPTILVMGGSSGAKRLNEALLGILPDLVKRFRVVHLTGRGKSIGYSHENYRGFDFVGAELRDLFALTDLVITRAGANAIFEVLALGKPMLLVPLEVGSRGDQVKNAESFVAHGWATMLRETQMDGPALLQAIEALEERAETIRAAQREYDGRGIVANILSVLDPPS